MRILNWDHADLTLKDIGILAREQAEWALRAEADIAAIRDKVVMASRPLARRQEDLEEALERFVRDHEDEMEGRSRKLTYGRVWIRLVKSVTARSWKRVLDWLVAHRKADYYRVKYEPNKETLALAHADFLKACGARIKEEDSFGYELQD
ncbi:MAG: host-nuclease inhibitor Gam family protein [candidate division NC10 bacterium]|nr:host-nuclease inhibitor Gam family protein [candidate division NC10 bacterium]